MSINSAAASRRGRFGMPTFSSAKFCSVQEPELVVSGSFGTAEKI
jgi:hypothetical protein